MISFPTIDERKSLRNTRSIVPLNFITCAVRCLPVATPQSLSACYIQSFTLQSATSTSVYTLQHTAIPWTAHPLPAVSLSLIDRPLAQSIGPPRRGRCPPP